MLENFDITGKQEQDIVGAFADELFVDRLLRRTDGLVGYLERVFFVDGPSIFGSASPEEMQEIRDRADGSLDNVSNFSVATILRNYFMRRKNYGHLEHLNAAGIKWARVIAFANSGTESCERHIDRFVQVERAYNRMTCLFRQTRDEMIEDISRYCYGFPPFSVECLCDMEGLIRGVHDEEIGALEAEEHRV